MRDARCEMRDELTIGTEVLAMRIAAAALMALLPIAGWAADAPVQFVK